MRCRKCSREFLREEGQAGSLCPTCKKQLLSQTRSQKEAGQAYTSEAFFRIFLRTVLTVLICYIFAAGVVSFFVSPLQFHRWYVYVLTFGSLGLFILSYFLMAKRVYEVDTSSHIFLIFLLLGPRTTYRYVAAHSDEVGGLAMMHIASALFALILFLSNVELFRKDFPNQLNGYGSVPVEDRTRCIERLIKSGATQEEIGKICFR